MNTAKQMVWLPTSREEKYKATQAIDMFFVRMGNRLIFVVLALVVAGLLLREYRRITTPATGPGA